MPRPRARLFAVLRFASSRYTTIQRSVGSALAEGSTVPSRSRSGGATEAATGWVGASGEAATARSRARAADATRGMGLPGTDGACRLLLPATAPSVDQPHQSAPWPSGHGYRIA